MCQIVKLYCPTQDHPGPNPGAARISTILAYLSSPTFFLHSSQPKKPRFLHIFIKNLCSNLTTEYFQIFVGNILSDSGLNVCPNQMLSLVFPESVLFVQSFSHKTGKKEQHPSSPQDLENAYQGVLHQFFL